MAKRHYAVDRVKKAIRTRIITDVYPAGSRLPSERKLAEQLDASRTTIITALNHLEREHCVTKEKGCSTRVISPAEKSIISPVAVLCHKTVQDVSHQHGSRETMHGIQTALTARGYHFKVLFTEEHRLETIDFKRKFCGVIATEIHPALATLLSKVNNDETPVIIAKCECKCELSQTCVDHLIPRREAVHMLKSMGHTHIAFIGREHTGFKIYKDSYNGFLEGMNDANLQIDEDLVIFCDNSDALSGYLATQKLFKRRNIPTAIITHRDAIAEGVCRALREYNISLGYEISVVGFDNTTWLNPSPIITTFDEPCFDMGVEAVKLLHERIFDPTVGIKHKILPTPLILRSTMGLVPKEIKTAHFMYS